MSISKLPHILTPKILLTIVCELLIMDRSYHIGLSEFSLEGKKTRQARTQCVQKIEIIFHKQSVLADGLEWDVKHYDSFSADIIAVGQSK